MHKDLVGSARMKDAMDVENDRLSSLPDDLIHKIISFMSIRDAIATSVLSSKWRSIWTSMPYLTFENLNNGPSISKFISNVLSHCDNGTQVSSVSLVLGRTVIDDESITIILKCAFSHYVQQLSVTRAPEKIGERPFDYRLSSIATPAWDLPALTTLHLHHIQLSDDNDFFSKFTNLKNLSLRLCTLMKGAKEYVNGVAPQLKTLTIKWCTGKLLISTPGLASLVIEDAHEIVRLLQHLRTAKLLILSLGILQHLFQEREHLSSSMELIPHQTCAIFPMVSHKEIKAMGYMKSALVFVIHLGQWLKQCKANTNNKAQMDENGKPQVKKHCARELQLNLGEMMALIKQSKSVAFETCLMMAKFKSCSSEILQIIEWLREMRSLFQCIEGLMTQLSASKKDVMQPIFSRLCEDATILTNNILGWMKTRQETQETNALII
ncbi:unnamed protein product [Lactuca virosa]|uniref:F-box domain-containing protein n=1 Tax=Lactuca virosa TaxID=75947 RepID=A0AAU9LYB7_9ASTR|nr:unnamed protein product [Lactuca virosa]